MNRKIIILFLFGFALLGCKKESVRKRTEFIGYWYCGHDYDNQSTISIDEDGYAIYQEYHKEVGRIVPSISGKATADDEKLKIGCFHHFIITEYPHQIDTTTIGLITLTMEGFTLKKTNWKMVLEGPKNYRGSGVYYKVDY